MQSPTKELFDSNWEAFRQDNPLTESAVDYIEKEWISRQIHFAHYSINQYMHISHFSSQGAESAHSKLKTWLETSTGNLLSCWTKLKETLLNSHQTYDNTMAIERKSCSGRIQNDPFYSSVIRKVSRFALSEVQKQEDLLKNRRARKQSVECRHYFRVVMGLPCSHELEELQDSDTALRYLGKEHFHPRWWLDKEVSTESIFQNCQPFLNNKIGHSMVQKSYMIFPLYHWWKERWFKNQSWS